ncbi:hypothetical protein C4G52_RS20720 [Vibrio parahaemolyticus]|nr:hypothetical protein [Vibrio parahaemolyticus]
MAIHIFSVDSQKPLFKNFSFWFWALLPITLGIAFGLAVWPNYTLSFTPEGYDRFLTISKLPIALMGLTFPSSAIYVYQYKSKQDTENNYMSKEREITNTFDSKLDAISSLTLSLNLLKKRLSAVEHLREKKIEPIESIIDTALTIYMDWIELLKNNQYMTILNPDQVLVDEIESRFLALRFIINNPKKQFWSHDFKDTCKLLEILSYKTLINFHHTHTQRYYEINSLRKSYGLTPCDITKIEQLDKSKVFQYENRIAEIRKS